MRRTSALCTASPARRSSASCVAARRRLTSPASDPSWPCTRGSLAGFPAVLLLSHECVHAARARSLDLCSTLPLFFSQSQCASLERRRQRLLHALPWRRRLHCQAVRRRVSVSRWPPCPPPFSLSPPLPCPPPPAFFSYPSSPSHDSSQKELVKMGRADEIQPVQYAAYFTVPTAFYTSLFLVRLTLSPAVARLARQPFLTPPSLPLASRARALARCLAAWSALALAASCCSSTPRSSPLACKRPGRIAACRTLLPRCRYLLTDHGAAASATATASRTRGPRRSRWRRRRSP